MEYAELNPSRINDADYENLKIQVRLAGFGGLADQMNAGSPRPSAGTTVILVVVGLALSWTIFVPIICIMFYFGIIGGGKKKHRASLAREAIMMLQAKENQG